VATGLVVSTAQTRFEKDKFIGSMVDKPNPLPIMSVVSDAPLAKPQEVLPPPLPAVQSLVIESKPVIVPKPKVKAKKRRAPMPC